MKNIKKVLNKSKAILFVAGIIVLALVSFYFYNQYQKAKIGTQNTSSKNLQAQAIIAAVGKLIVLPRGETPEVATVSDKNKLPNQPFFAVAQNGDYILLYAKAKEAILYRPNSNKIILVSAVNIAQATPATSAATTKANVSIVIYNGTTTIGLAKLAQTAVKNKLPDITSKTQNAAKDTYTQTAIIDLSGKNTQLVNQLVGILRGKVQTSVPVSEIKPSADILIILGSDFASK